jgi:transcriptional regulator with XRE-family HTH domain
MARKVKSIEQIDKHVGNQIKKQRLAMGLSRQELGEAIHATHQQIQKYEIGANRVSAGRLAVIAKFLKKPIGYFYEDLGDDELNQEVDLTTHQRMCLEVARNFMKIKDPDHKEAINSLIRKLAGTVKL